jgi:hypothetical protein
MTILILSLHWQFDDTVCLSKTPRSGLSNLQLILSGVGQRLRVQACTTVIKVPVEHHEESPTTRQERGVSRVIALSVPLQATPNRIIWELNKLTIANTE